MKHHVLEIPAVLGSLEIATPFMDAVLRELPDMPGRDSLVPDLALVATEALTNAIRHGDVAEDKLVRLEFFLYPEKIIINVTDYGIGFDPDKVRPPDFDGYPEGGFGIYIMKSLMDEVRYERSAAGNTLILSKQWKED